MWPIKLNKKKSRLSIIIYLLSILNITFKEREKLLVIGLYYYSYELYKKKIKEMNKNNNNNSNKLDS